MLTKAVFISTTINNSLVVKSTKVDSTIKAIINNYRKIKG
jgi:flagellar biosynthesis GTPase FlhF